jgi:DNA-directed RNA polymerase subunit RPC12/RpoP
MTASALHCAECKWPLPPESWNREYGMACPGCGTRVLVTVFPSIDHARSGVLPEALQDPTEASCFYHPLSRAAVPCDECGRFLCALCEIPADGRHLCPGCFQVALANRKINEFDTRRTMYDSIALLLATLPALLIWPPLVTAPAALYFAFRYWKAPGSVAPRTRYRYWLSGLLAAAEIVGVVLLIYVAIRGFRAGRQ